MVDGHPLYQNSCIGILPPLHLWMFCEVVVLYVPVLVVLSLAGESSRRRRGR